MFVLIHENGCGGICYKREMMPELNTPLDEKHCFNLDDSPVERTQPVICQSCGVNLKLSEVHPRYWREEWDCDMNTENEEYIAMQLARIIYPDQEIISAKLDEDGMLHLQMKLNKPVHYIQFTTEIKD